MPAQHRSEGSPRVTNQFVAMTTAEALLSVEPTNSGGGHALWSNVRSVSGGQPYQAHLGAASEVMYPQLVLGTRAESMGLDMGVSTWTQNLGATSVHAVPAAENLYPLPSANSSNQLESSNSNGLLRISEEFWQRSKYPEPLDFESSRIGYKHNLAFPPHDDNIGDLRFAVPQMQTHLAHSEEAFGRRPFISTYSMSSTGLSPDPLPHIEPSNPPTVSAQATEYVARPSTDPSSSTFNSVHSSRRHVRQEHARPSIRERASSSPRRSMRAAPYSIDPERSNRWSTGSVSQAPTLQHGSASIYPRAEGYSSFPGRHLSVPPSPSQPYIGFSASPSNDQAHGPHILASQPLTFQRLGTLLSLPIHYRNQAETSSPLPSPQVYRVSQPSGESKMQQRYHDPQIPDPPDLYASLRTEEDPPPPEDMNTTDSDLVPHRQDLRFDGDLYTPRWVRGQGNKREGWCGICKPGRWLVLKNSAFWYDKSFSHGISAATGAPFEGPQANRPLEGNPDVWEGFCGGCHEWIPLVSSKRKGTTWFRHAYKVCIL